MYIVAVYYIYFYVNVQQQSNIIIMCQIDGYTKHTFYKKKTVLLRLTMKSNNHAYAYAHS